MVMCVGVGVFEGNSGLWVWNYMFKEHKNVSVISTFGGPPRRLVCRDLTYTAY